MGPPKTKDPPRRAYRLTGRVHEIFSEKEDRVRQLSGLPSASVRLGRTTADEIDQISFGSLAVVARESFRSMALRPRLSAGLPLSGFHRFQKNSDLGCLHQQSGRFW